MTKVSLRQMASPPEPDRMKLDELEHQALDALDSIGVEAPRDSAIESAIALARPLFIRLVAATADDLLKAAATLAATEDRGSLEPEALEQARRALHDQPEIALAFPRAVEMVGITLGLDRESLAWALLVELGERASAEAPELVQVCVQAIGERLEVAWTAGASEPSRALRVFRSAVAIAAGPELRARLLAADQPEHLGLARALIEADPAADPATLVDRFDGARAALAESPPSPALSPPGPEAITDGPKRKFTIVHAILALIILGLTIWHYVFR